MAGGKELGACIRTVLGTSSISSSMMIIVCCPYYYTIHGTSWYILVSRILTEMTENVPV
jgi:hypothetical protein